MVLRLFSYNVTYVLCGLLKQQAFLVFEAWYFQDLPNSANSAIHHGRFVGGLFSEIGKVPLEDTP